MQSFSPRFSLQTVRDGPLRILQDLPLDEVPCKPGAWIVAQTWGALLSAWQAESQPSAKARSKWASNSASATNIRLLPAQASSLLTKAPPWKDLMLLGKGHISWGVCAVVGCLRSGQGLFHPAPHAPQYSRLVAASLNQTPFLHYS